MLRSLGLLAILTFAWGTNWSVMKIGVTELPPLWFRGLGLAIGTALLGVVLVARGLPLRVPRGAWRAIIALSLPNVMIWYSVVTIAITMLPAGRAAILGFTMPAWAALIGAVIYREPIDRRTAFGVGCAVAAIVLVVAGDWTALRSQPLGVVLMLFAAASWAWGTHVYSRTSLAMDTLVLTFWMMAVACPVIIGASALFEGSQWRMPSAAQWIPIFYNAILVIAIGNLIWFMLAREMPPALAGLSSMLIPAVGVVSGMVVLDEKPSWQDLAALGLIGLAVVAALVRRPVAVVDRARS